MKCKNCGNDIKEIEVELIITKTKKTRVEINEFVDTWDDIIYELECDTENGINIDTFKDVEYSSKSEKFIYGCPVCKHIFNMGAKNENS